MEFDPNFGIAVIASMMAVVYLARGQFFGRKE
jgi:hypothetical protein